MGVDLSKFAADRDDIPTIFRVNFRDPSGFFAARRFPMRDDDIIYVDNADQVEITKFLNMITTITGAASSVASDAANTKGSILYLENCCATMSGVLNCSIAMTARLRAQSPRARRCNAEGRWRNSSST